MACCKLKYGEDWTGFVKHSFAKGGFVKHGFIKGGIVKHGFVRHGFLVDQCKGGFVKHGFMVTVYLFLPPPISSLSARTKTRGIISVNQPPSKVGNQIKD